MNDPLISVIIPAYNEERDVSHCLESLKLQTYHPLEIIVVDDGSTDKSLKIVSSLRGIRLVKQEHLGPAQARNKGVKKAKGEILVFVDADMTFEKHFIDKLTKPIREGKSIGTFSKEEYVANNNERWARLWSLNRGFREGRMHPTSQSDRQKVFRAILKKDFDSVGGFTPGVGYTDDWTLSQKLGEQAVAAEAAVFFHRNPQTLSEVFAQSRWMAQRPYKLGAVGMLLALLRVSFPISLMVGVAKAIRYRTPAFVPFRLLTDWGQTVGISRLLMLRRRVK